MNKTIEYMALSCPWSRSICVSAVSASDAAVYVPPNDEHQYANAIVALMDDERQRLQMGERGRVRVEQELAWSYHGAPTSRCTGG